MQKARAILSPILPPVLALPILLAAIGCNDDTQPPMPPAEATQPTTPPATQPTSQANPSPATNAPTSKPVTYLDWARTVSPALADSKLADQPVSVERASALLTSDSTYIDPSGRMWVHHPDAPPLDLSKFQKFTFPHLSSAKVVLADHADPPVVLVESNAESNAESDSTVQILRAGRPPIPVTNTSRSTDSSLSTAIWSSSCIWLGHAVVPTPAGIKLINLDTGSVASLDLPVVPVAATAAPQSNSTPSTPPVTYALAKDGVFVWRPWENGQAGSAGVWWWQTGAKELTRLPESDGYMPRPVHIMPLTDGAVLQLYLPGPAVAGVELAPEAPLALSVAIPASVAPPPMAEAELTALLSDLIDVEEATRTKAYDKLQQAGPSVWKQLEAAAKLQPPETRLAVNRVLGLRARPRLGTFRILDGRTQVLARNSGGDVILHFPGGAAAVTTVAGQSGFVEQVIEPATLWVRPGKRVAALAGYILFDNTPPVVGKISTFGEEILVADALRGPRRYMGNHLADLLPKSLHDYSFLQAIDRDGRWLLRKLPTSPVAAPPPQAQPAPEPPNPPQGGQSSVRFNEPPKAPAPPESTLILDTYLPDPRPRLLAWVVPIKQGRTGWTADNKLAIERGGLWQLDEYTWLPVPPGTNLITESSKGPAGAPAAFASAVPIGNLGKAPALQPVTGGITELAVGGKNLELPAEAVGEDGFPAFITEDSKGRIWLMNSPGKIHVLTREGDALNHVDTFARDLPSRSIRRVWMDPFGRICIAHDDNVTVLFLDGEVPRALRSQVRGLLQ